MLVIVGVIIYRMVANKRNGKGGCGCDCAHCHAACAGSLNTGVKR